MLATVPMHDAMPEPVSLQGYFDDETCRLEPIENPFTTRVSGIWEQPVHGLFTGARSRFEVPRVVTLGTSHTLLVARRLTIRGAGRLRPLVGAALTSGNRSGCSIDSTATSISRSGQCR